jgi:hypothetical protein
VVFTGTTSGGSPLAGVVGSSQIIDGGQWQLNIEHNDGSGWTPNASVVTDAMIVSGASMSQIVRTKDAFNPGDTDPNDLILRVEKVGPMFEITLRPYAVDGDTLMMYPDGVFVALNGIQLMGAEIKNTWGQVFDPAFTIMISPLGRATLASSGITVSDGWSVLLLTATQQTVIGGQMSLPPLDVGNTHIVYFLVDASAARKGKPPVEMLIGDTRGVPDPGNMMRRNSRTIFIADLSYDADTGVVSASTPEGVLSLKLRALSISSRDIKLICRNVGGASKPECNCLADDLKRLAGVAKSGHCDQRMIRELLRLLCRCINPDGHGGNSCCGDGHGWNRQCLGNIVWLPIEFDYTLTVPGGYTGQHAPLAFQDPWWKVLLLIIAVIAWLVGLIASIVGEHTGWGNIADKSKKIGVVGSSSLANVDAAIAELDGSRGFQQSVADVITGEPNNSPIVGVDTVINIVPTVAPPTMSMLVYKSGSRTGLTHGVITATSAPVAICRGEFVNGSCVSDPNHPDQNLTGQITIARDPAFPAEEQFSDHGDSGSIVLSRNSGTENQVVGLLYGGSDTVTDVNPIQDVLTALSLRLTP